MFLLVFPKQFSSRLAEYLAQCGVFIVVVASEWSKITFVDSWSQLRRILETITVQWPPNWNRN